MPVRIQDGLPAVATLSGENIFVMTDSRASSQDIRPLKILILNLMPSKIATETQLLRVIGNTPLQVEVKLLHTASYQGTHTEPEHLRTFYSTFDEVKDGRYDGMIITGAPVEQMDFREVKYWDELTTIFDWAEEHVFSTMFICWAAQAAMHYFYGLEKRQLDEKLFGVFPHRVLQKNHKLLRGFDDVFYAPHSRHSDVSLSDIEKVNDLDILCVSDEAGVFLSASRDCSKVFVTGHGEYDPETLDLEYKRDTAAGKPIHIPANYYTDDDPEKPPIVRWRAHGNLLYTNWLNYFVYQETPFDVNAISKKAHP